MSRKTQLNYGKVTQLELLAIAIEKYSKEHEKLKNKIATFSPEDQERFLQPTKEKLESLLKMYEIENGDAYPLEIDL